ncbi:hypothetical protein FIV42_10580 [Persicimonas caeni]|uniref:Amine oxidase domain-containing protein n=1 Tax=Persicimonas caeni TaxID=2292766 RepID=A0A4Y6PS61_PERCE|nr:hypothetical protein FIV42_10580 [Persicimonas caeni]QED32387.1 hypothetical protein FRD00_10575 [Persicimonas caeni]
MKTEQAETDRNPNAHRVAIVGGLAGLLTANHLLDRQRPGQPTELVLFEASAQPGGRARSLQLGGAKPAKRASSTGRLRLFGARHRSPRDAISRRRALGLGRRRRRSCRISRPTTHHPDYLITRTTH